MCTRITQRRKSGAPGCRVLRVACLLVLFLASACSTTRKEGGAQLPVHYVHQDGFDLTWREQRDGPDILFYGVLRNDHQVYLQNLTMTVHLLDEEGTIVDSRTYSAFPVTFLRHASIPFSMKFPYRSCREGERAEIGFNYTLANSFGPHYGVYQTICFLDDKPK